MPVSPARSILFAEIITPGQIFLTPHNEWAIVHAVDDVIYYRIEDDTTNSVWMLSPAIAERV